MDRKTITRKRICCNNIDRLRALLDARQVRRVFLVADEPAFTLSGARSLIADALAGREAKTFSAFTPNPKGEEIEAGVAEFRSAGWDAVIAIGGGSAMDVAKLIRACDVAGGSAAEVIQKEKTISTSGPPLIAVPTTAGTGSEATHFAAVYLHGRKHSVADASMRPSIVFLDERLIASLPKKVAMATGLDALCQAIESAWSVRSTAASRNNAFRALRLAWQYFPEYLDSPTRTNRRAMLLAAHLAGRAIDISQTTACHALSYSLTSHWGIPHGQAVALMMPPVWEFNAAVNETSVSDPRGLPHVRQVMQQIARCMGSPSVEEVPNIIRATWRRLGAAVTFGELGINPTDAISRIAAELDSARGGNNPRLITPAQVTDLLQGNRM